MTSRITTSARPRCGGRVLVLAVVAALLASCAGPPAAATPAASPLQSSVPRGGTLRVVVPAGNEVLSFASGAPEFLDPHKDFNRLVNEVWRCCLVRTLVSYNGLSVEEGGSRAQPDLAAALPEVSSDGLTWTIRIKPGITYGPPLQDVEITTQDFVRGLHRLLAPVDPSLDTYLWVNFADIEGAGEYHAGTAASISGLETPDAHTLVIRLTHPLGDFLARLAQPQVAPLPPNPAHPDAAFGIATGADEGYGRFLVSSGPYMLEGSEALDFSVAATQRTPAAGIGPGRLTLVRNPSWDAASDSLRPAYPDRIEIGLVDSTEAAMASIDSGSADLLWNPKTPPTLAADAYAAVQSDPARGRVHVDPAGTVRGIIMNLAVPPFDDIHVRRAVNLVLDKQQIADLQGGPSAARVATHIASDSSEDGLLRDYDPYATPGHRGDLTAARAEMALSQSDTDGDGRCDVAACRQVKTWTREPFSAAARSAADDFQELGIDLDVEVLDMQAFFDTSADPRARVALYVGLAYHSIYIGAWGQLGVFDGPYGIWIDEADPALDQANGTLVGATPEQLERWGYEGVQVPNVDARVEACVPLVGAAQFECWAALDQYLMEQVVPWIPYSEDVAAALTSPRVVHYGYDEYANTTALDQIALSP